MTDGLVLRRRVHFHEVDFAGVLYFANYYRYMEEAEHAFFRLIDLPIFDQRDGVDVIWPRVSSKCDYLSPAKFGDELDIYFQTVKIGSKSITHEVDFRNNGTRTALGHMTAVHCLGKAGDFSPAPIPDDVRQKFEARMKPTG